MSEKLQNVFYVPDQTFYACQFMLMLSFIVHFTKFIEVLLSHRSQSDKFVIVK